MAKRSQVMPAFLRLCSALWKEQSSHSYSSLPEEQGRGKFIWANAGISYSIRSNMVPENVSVMHSPDHKLYLNRISQAFCSQIFQEPNESNYPLHTLHRGPRFFPLLGPLREKGAARAGQQWWLLQTIAFSQLQAATARIKLLQTVDHAWAAHHLVFDRFIYFLKKWLMWSAALYWQLQSWGLKLMSFFFRFLV